MFLKTWDVRRIGLWWINYQLSAVVLNLFGIYIQGLKRISLIHILLGILRILLIHNDGSSWNIFLDVCQELLWQVWVVDIWYFLGFIWYIGLHQTTWPMQNWILSWRNTLLLTKEVAVNLSRDLWLWWLNILLRKKDIDIGIQTFWLFFFWRVGLFFLYIRSVSNMMLWALVIKSLPSHLVKGFTDRQSHHCHVKPIRVILSQNYRWLTTLTIDFWANHSFLFGLNIFFKKSYL